MRQATVASVICLTIYGCASTPAIWTKTPETPKTSHLGTVVRVAEVPTINTSSDAQRSAMSMYGLAGALAVEILGTKRGYPVYRVKVSEEMELAVASREEFVLGDCVQVSYPVEDKRQYFGLGEASIIKTSGCAPAKGE
jgi:hypothetical protein